MRFLSAFLLLSNIAFAAPATFDKSSGTIEWKGEMIGGETHKGTVELKSGSFDLSKKKGEFVIDMNTITPIGLPSDKKNKLAQHLSGPDFFDTAAFPEAKIVIKDLSKDSAKDQYSVTADVTIRGETQEEKFPVIIGEKDKKLDISASFPIDRSRYKQKFQLENDAGAIAEAKAFLERTGTALKQSVIKNNFEIQIQLKSK